MATIVAREKESKLLDQIYMAREAQFVALYGRRRVGKTYLINQFYSKKGVYLEVTGIRKGSLPEQLENFMDAFSQSFYPGLKLKTPKRWRDAFQLLTDEFKKVPKNKKIIIFLDELPWLATKRSNLLAMLDYFWNTKWSKQQNLILVVCGSAASWMINKVIKSKGGLHNRLTQTILLEPYNLKQTESFLKARGLRLSRKQILDIYMAMGGIPFYLKSVRKGRSATQTINELCFDKNGLLFGEFNKLFESLFENAELNIEIVRAIAKKRYGISRNDLIKALKLKSGGLIKQRLEELIAAGFIQRFIPYGKKKKDHYFRVIDEYTLFYLQWIEHFTLNPRSLPRTGHWQKISNTPQWLAWSGYTFEEICYKHIDQIAKALDIEHIVWDVSSWRQVSKSDGAQIDLLFDRQDGVITLFEIKYSINKFKVDKAVAKNLMNKVDIFEKYVKPSKDIQLAMITTSGLQPSAWSDELIQSEVILDDFFEE